MKIKINSNKLKEILKIANEVCDSGSSNLLLECILITTNKENNTLTCIFLNNSLKIKYETKENINIIESGTILLKIKTLDSIISKLSNEELILEKIDSRSLRIEKNNFVANINIIDENLFIPIDFEINKNLQKITLNSSLFKEVKNKNFQCCLNKNDIGSNFKNDKMSHLIGIFFDSINNSDKLNIISTDGFKIAQLTKDIKLDEKINLILETETINFINSNIEENSNIDFYISQDKIQFIHKELTVISKIINATYPNIYNVMDLENCETSFEINAKVLHDIIDRGYFVVNSNKTPIVFLNINDESLNVKYKSEDIGDFNEIVKISKFNGNNASISLNSKFLISMLKTFGNHDIKIYWFNKSPYYRMIFEDLTDDYKQLLMPLRN